MKLTSLLSLFLTLATFTLSAADTFRVTWLDTPGVHGLAVVLETLSGKVILVDTGGTRKDPDYNSGRDAVAPFLRAHGHTEIEAIVISHPHGDHYGGAEWLMNNMKVKQFIDHGYEGRGQTEAYTRLRKLAVEKGGAYRVAQMGARLDFDPALSIEVLSPPAEFIDAASDKVSEHGLLNSNSIVLRVQHGENVFLFPGDSYGGGFERQLQAHVPAEKLRATVLTANHHGFNPGVNFPRLVAPKFVVVSCIADYASNAGTPNPRSPGDRAIQTYGALGAEVFVTAFNGEISATSDGHTVTMKQAHDRPASPPLAP